MKDRITHQELVDMFGLVIPMEAVNLIYFQEVESIDELRSKLSDIALRVKDSSCDITITVNLKASVQQDYNIVKDELRFLVTNQMRNLFRYNLSGNLKMDLRTQPTVTVELETNPN